MSSFHQQWMAAHTELERLPASVERVRLRQRLADARDLVDEDNPSALRLRGGELIREIRQACARIRETA